MRELASVLAVDLCVPTQLQTKGVAVTVVRLLSLRHGSPFARRRGEGQSAMQRCTQDLWAQSYVRALYNDLGDTRVQHMRAAINI